MPVYTLSKPNASFDACIITASNKVVSTCLSMHAGDAVTKLQDSRFIESLRQASGGQVFILRPAGEGEKVEAISKEGKVGRAR